MVRDGAAGQEFPISSLDGLPVVTVPEELDLGNAHWFGEALQAAGASRLNGRGGTRGAGQVSIARHGAC
jgi:hypothetical protein